MRRAARLAAYLGPFAVGVLLTRGAWGGRPPAGDDVHALLMWEEFGQELWADGRPDGWFPGFLLGYQRYLLYGPGLSAAITIVRAATFFQLSIAGAFKVVGVLAFAAVAPATVFLARCLGIRWRGAVAAGVLALAVNNPFGLGLSAVYGVALLPQQVAASLFLVALGATAAIAGGDTAVTGHRRFRVALAVVVAAMLVTHPITVAIFGVVAALMLAALASMKRVSWTGVRGVAVAGGLAAALAGFWLVPYLVHLHLRGPVTSVGVPAFSTRLGELVRGRFVVTELFGLLLVAGFLYALVAASRRSRPAWGALAAVPLAFLAVAHWSFHEVTNDVALHLPVRGVGLAVLLALVPAGAFIGWVSGVAGSRGPIAAGIIATVLVVVWGPPAGIARQMPEPAPEMSAAARRLAAVVPDGARFATERDYPGEIERLGVSHPDFWLARHSNRWTLNVFGIELSTSPGVYSITEQLLTTPPADAADRLARLGVTHVVTVSAGGRATLSLSPSFAVDWQEGSLAVFEVVPRGRVHDPADLVTPIETGVRDARLVEQSRGRFAFSLETVRSVTVDIAVAWSPNWSATVDGRKASLARAPDGLMRITVPEGTSRVELGFDPFGGWELLGWFVTAAGVAAVVRYGRRPLRD